MKQIKPVILGYNQVTFKGVQWVGFTSKNLIPIRLLKDIAASDYMDTGVKSKFRPVYAYEV